MERRNERIMVRLGSDELELLQAAAGGRPLGRFLRECGVGQAGELIRARREETPDD
jgi:uncharacterized protein (DUF1778 family)